MKLDDQDSICEDFAKRHDLLVTGLVQREYPAIYWTIRAKLEVDSVLSSHTDALIDNEPTFGLLLSMLGRVFEHVEGSIVAFITGSPASAEVIARTVVESALNVMYILDNDRNNSHVQYFSSYINQERKELKHWSELTQKMNETDSGFHKLCINLKEQHINNIETCVKNHKIQIGSNNNICTWPKIYERFQKLGCETDYRVLYAAMCSQTHNDAEDTLNYFFHVTSGNRESLEQCAIQTVNFSRFLMYQGIRYYLKAAHCYALCFKLDDAIPALNESRDAISEMLLKISADLNKT